MRRCRASLRYRWQPPLRAVSSLGGPATGRIRRISVPVAFSPRILIQLVGFDLTEQYLDTDNELIRHVVLGMLAYFAKLQRDKISENTKSALARKKAQGVKLGQPSKFERHRAELGRDDGGGGS